MAPLIDAGFDPMPDPAGGPPHLVGPAPGQVDPRYAGVLKLFTILTRTTAALHERSHADIQRHGLTATEFAVLEALYHKGPLLHGEVREKVLVSSGGITYLVDRLEGRGLLERRDCPNDRRARYVSLTPAGVALMDEVFPQHAQAIEEAMAALSAEERAGLTLLLRRLGRGAEGLP